MFHLGKRKDIFIGLFGSLWIIIFSVLVMTFIPVLYDMFIDQYHVDMLTGLSLSQIKESYHTIVNYLFIGHFGSLVVPHFTLTDNTLVHFEEVKMIFIVFQLYIPIAGIVLIHYIRSCIKDREVEFIKWIMIFTIIIVGMIGILGVMDFSEAFILMHKILFRNDFWLMDPKIDPVIYIFPEGHFETLFIGIIVCIIIINIILFIIYKKKRRDY